VTSAVPSAVTPVTTETAMLPLKLKRKQREADEHRLGQRQKQIDYGKATVGYNHYLDLVPRKNRNKEEPRTPDKHQMCSKRSWDGQVRKWRRLLHSYDPESTDSSSDSLDLIVDVDSIEEDKDNDVNDSVTVLTNEQVTVTEEVDLIPSSLHSSGYCSRDVSEAEKLISQLTIEQTSSSSIC